MTLYNPFMPWLNPRSSGLITFKGGGDGASASEVETIVTDATAPIVTAGNAINANLGTATEGGVVQATGGSMTMPTTSIDPDTGEVITGTKTVDYGGGDVAVTDTVKGDTEGLLAGQSDLSSQVSSGFANFQPVNVTNTSIDTSDLAKSAAMDAGFAQSIVNQDNNTDRILADTGQIGGIASDVTGLGTAVDTGFTDVGKQLGTLETGQSGISGKVDDLSGNVTKRFDTVDNTLDTGFAGVNTNIDNRFDAQNEDLTDLSANVLGGQTNLQNYLEGMSGRADTYYGGLAEGQAGLLENVGGLQSNFQDFRNTYDTNTTLANQTRAELMDSVSGGFNNMRGTMSDNFADTRNDVNRVASQVDNVQNRQAATTQSQTMDLSQTIRDLASGLQATNRDQAANQSNVVDRLNTVKDVLVAQGDNIPNEIRSQYTNLATAFDDSGRLIRESVNEQGVTTRRSMDNQTNLLSAQFDQRGNAVGQSVINVNSLLGQLENFGYTGRGSPGQLTPSSMTNQRAANSGLMQRQEPFIRTIG